jgi:hypothetical protein
VVAKLLRDDLAYLRKSEGCFKTELNNLPKRFRAVPDRRNTTERIFGAGCRTAHSTSF